MSLALTSSGQLQQSRSAPALKPDGQAIVQVISLEHGQERIPASRDLDAGIVTPSVSVTYDFSKFSI